MSNLQFLAYYYNTSIFPLVASIKIYETRYFFLAHSFIVIDVDTSSEFYYAWVDKLFTYSVYKLGNRQEAEDVVSESFLRFMKAHGLEKKQPVGYLYMICRNIIYDHYRQAKHTTSLENLMAQGVDFAVSPNYEQQVVYNQILSSIQELPEDQKDVLLLQYVQGLDNRTIANALGKSESAVKSLSYRGLETLRKQYSSI